MGERFILYYFCDIWKSLSSMCLRGVFDRMSLNNQIKEDLKETNIESDIDYDMISSFDIRGLNDSIDYAYFEEISINEVL